MSWGTYYKYDGYLSHVSKREVDEKIDENERVLDQLWGEILALAAMTPPMTFKNEEGDQVMWYEHLTSIIRDYRRQISEYEAELTRYYQCREVMAEKPEDVTEG